MRYLQAENINDALTYAIHEPAAVFVAGGTDVFINRQQGNSKSPLYIDISGIAELKGVEKEKNNLMIGSMATLSEISQNRTVIQYFDALRAAVMSVATPVIRQTATIGGNILCENRCIFYNQSEFWREAVGYCLKCNGEVCIATGGKKNCFSKFVSDTALALMAYDAKVQTEDYFGEKINDLEDLYSGDGVSPLKKDNKNAIIKRIVIPLDRNYKAVFKKLRPRKSLDFTSLTTVVSVDRKNKIRMAIGGVDPMPVLITGNREDDPVMLIKKAVKKPRIIDNDFYSRKYRKDMLQYFLEESFRELEIIK